MNKPSIAIIGAGPGGLTLARILHLHGFEPSVFEREPASTARSQGGSLDLHAESAQYALELAGLTPEFKRIARYEDQECRLYGKHGHLHFIDTDTASSNRPEVDRGHLRQILLDSVPSEHVHWNHQLTAIRPDGTAFELEFQTGARATFDLVIGADGGRSRVRPLVSPAQPIYSGVSFIELGIDDADAHHPEVTQLVGRGLMFALGDRKGLIAHRDANAHIGVYAALTVPENWPSAPLDKTSLDAHFDGWSPNLRQLIAAASGIPIVRPINALPIGHRWEHRTGVTLLGDAAHLMSPFTGEGVNLAMWDAADLALSLAQNSDPDAAVASYEAVMFERAATSAAAAAEAIRGAFTDDGLEFLKTQFVSHGQ